MSYTLQHGSSVSKPPRFYRMGNHLHLFVNVVSGVEANGRRSECPDCECPCLQRCNWMSIDNQLRSFEGGVASKKSDAPVSAEALYRRRVSFRVVKFWMVLKTAVVATNSCQLASQPADCGSTWRVVRPKTLRWQVGDVHDLKSIASFRKLGSRNRESFSKI